jgi:prolyl 4-hydroxylase
MSADAQALEAKARAGDVDAQFQMAVTLDRAGKRAEASQWLERAGEGGHPMALTLLAVTDLQGLERPRNPQSATARLQRAAAAGSTQARRLLGSLTAIGIVSQADWSAGITLVIDAARTGDWEALRDIALLLEMADPGSLVAQDLLLRAALKGDGLAAFAILRRQMQTGRAVAREEICVQWRNGMSRVNHPLASTVANAVVQPDAQPPLPEGEPDWARIAERLATPPDIAIANAQSACERPPIRRFDKLLTVEECEYLMGLSARHLRPAEIVDQSSGQPLQSRVRTNHVAVMWPVQQDLVLHALNLRLAAAAGLPPQNGEMINVLVYRPGEEYRPHYDFFPLEAAKADVSGQRIRTLLVYLNAGYDGGETHFLTAGMKIKGNIGDAVLFHNCDAAGAPDKSSLHAGLAVTSGQKWLLSKWYREKPFVY